MTKKNNLGTFIFFCVLNRKKMATTTPSPLVTCDLTQYLTWGMITYAEWVPWVYAILLFFAYYLTKEPAYSYVSWYITFMCIPLYPAQAYFDYQFRDPFCNYFTMWTFPHFGSACAGGLLFLLIMFVWLYKLRPGLLGFIIMGLLLVAPASIVVWKKAISVWEVFASAGWGIGCAIIFFAVLWVSKDSLPYLFNIPIYCNWVNESFLLRDEATKLKYRQLKKWREARERSMPPSTFWSGSLSWLSFRFGQIKSPQIPQDSVFGISDSTSSQTTYPTGEQTLPSTYYLPLPLSGSRSSVFQTNKAPRR